MEQSVSVLVTTVSDGGTLTFRGSGTLRRDARGVHLRYAASHGGDAVPAELHLGMGRALLRTAAARLLLDPERPTLAELAAGGAAIPLTVTTHAVRSDLEDHGGAVFLQYTIASAGRDVDTFRVTLTVEPFDSDKESCT